MIPNTTLAADNPLGASPATQGAWRTALAWLCVSLAGVVVLYWNTASAMVYIWYRSETFAHCFLVGPISLWLIWQKSKELAPTHPSPSLLYGFLILGAAALWLLGDLAAVNAATQLAFVLTLILIVPAVLGVAVARKITFPLAFLIFAVPIGEFAMPLMMQWTAHFTVLALRLTGIPVYQEGLQFVIPSGNWSVVEACSGIRYLIASTVVGALFAYLNYTSVKRRLIFVGLSILVPVLANWMRAYMIVSLGHYSSNQLAVGADHLIYGWVFFGLVIGIMFMIGARWAEPPLPAKANTSAGTVGAEQKPPGPAFWRAAVLVLLITALPHGANWTIERANLASKPKLDPPAFAQWAESSAFADWKPAFENPSAEFQQTLEHNGQRVGLYLAYYRNQDYEHKLVSSNNVIVKSEDKIWATTRTGQRQVVLNGQPTAVRTAEIRQLRNEGSPGSELRLNVMSFYWINGRLTTSDSIAKIHTALSRLLGQGDDSALVVLYASKAEGQGEAALESFARANGRAILENLQKTRDRR